jgi:hypothetical protein
MQVINITSLSGTAPYDIYVCDTTITYCFFVASGVSTVPQVIDLPPFLSGVESIIIKVIDYNRIGRNVMIGWIGIGPSFDGIGR